MPHNLQDSIALLTRMPLVLDALLRDLPEVWTGHNEGGESWSVREIVGHLIYCERDDWMPRARVILKSGENAPFPPFDRLGFVPLIQGKTLAYLLGEFARLRNHNLRELKGWNLGEAELAKRGKHPVFGRVTLSQMLATWAAHDLTHLHQISRVMAYQYREAVGPWSAYLGVMQCQGHSAG